MKVYVMFHETECGEFSNTMSYKKVPLLSKLKKLLILAMQGSAVRQALSDPEPLLCATSVVLGLFLVL